MNCGGYNPVALAYICKFGLQIITDNIYIPLFFLSKRLHALRLMVRVDSQNAPTVVADWPHAATFAPRYEKPAGHIPRPCNSFFIFRKEFGIKYKQGLIEPMKQGTISQQAGMMWKAMSKEEKQRYEDLAEKEKEDHGKKFPGYVYRPQRRRKAKSRPTKQVIRSRPTASDAALSQSKSESDKLDPTSAPTASVSPAFDYQSADDVTSAASIAASPLVEAQSTDNALQLSSLDGFYLVHPAPAHRLAPAHLPPYPSAPALPSVASTDIGTPDPYFCLAFWKLLCSSCQRNNFYAFTSGSPSGLANVRTLWRARLCLQCVYRCDRHAQAAFAIAEALLEKPPQPSQIYPGGVCPEVRGVAPRS